ncbi:WD40 repeat domain-containing protein [Rubinisphaera margarita]|uniref:WD40 repeat domain-containing protein n=1 Tax=Rubinisphaera margarita TaxID=2909586 RepID=UPI001EE8688D|nr:hypothetical protein [Rubinisphaera margarita]MCG6158367.1 hypothetical protein [Rubinisphaera margarita]
MKVNRLTDDHSVQDSTFLAVAVPRKRRRKSPLMFLLVILGVCVSTYYSIHAKSFQWENKGVEPRTSVAEAPLGGVFNIQLSAREDSLLARGISGRSFEINLTSGEINQLGLDSADAQLMIRNHRGPIVIASGNTDKYQVRFNLRSRTPQVLVPQLTEVTAACLMNNGEFIAIACRRDRSGVADHQDVFTVDILSTLSGELVKTVECPQIIFDIACDPETQTLYSATQFGLYAIEAGADTVKQVDSRSFRSVEIVAASRLLIAGHFNGETSAISMDTFEDLWITAVSKYGAIKALVCDPTGTIIATGGESSIVTLLDVSTGRTILALDQRGSAVNDLTFSSDGRLLFIARTDATVTATDVNSGATMHSISL